MLCAVMSASKYLCRLLHSLNSNWIVSWKLGYIERVTVVTGSFVPSRRRMAEADLPGLKKPAEGGVEACTANSGHLQTTLDAPCVSML